MVRAATVKLPSAIYYGKEMKEPAIAAQMLLFAKLEVKKVEGAVHCSGRTTTIDPVMGV